MNDVDIRDPLRDDNIGPRGTPGFERSGREVGRNLDSLGRAAFLTALPLVGAGIGHYVSGGDPYTTAGLGILGGAGSLYSLAHGALTTAVPHDKPASPGTAVGGWIGRKLDERSGRSALMVDRIKSLSPDHGYALINHLEQSNAESPEVLSAMKDAYNTRRIGIQEQLKVSSLGIPRSPGFTDPLNEDTAPQGVPKYHMYGKRIGGALGTGLSVALPALAGGLLEHHYFGSSGAIGAGLGAVGGTIASPIGHELGKSIGRGIGNVAENFAPEDQKAVEAVRGMSPQDAFVHIRALERAGKTNPHVLNAMREAYNYRRQGLGYQAQAGVGQA